MDTNDAAQITAPTEFNIHALASAILDGALAVRMTTGLSRQVHSSRLSGLLEAWALLTQPNEVLNQMVKDGPTSAQTYMARVEYETAHVIAHDTWVARVEQEA